MVVEARAMVDNGQAKADAVDALNAFGYEEAAQHVYGMTYGDWKKRHQKKATDEDMKRYEASAAIHAPHDKSLLATRVEKPPASQSGGSSVDPVTSQAPSSSLLSNVCCQEVDVVKPKPSNSRIIPPFQPPSLPQLAKPVRLAVLTVSDRASKNEYTSGDLSGPAVIDAAKRVRDQWTIISSIVPDDAEAIQAQIKAWCTDGIDIVLTTGGTGMSPRDVTPEATRDIVNVECPGLMQFVTTECSRLQPLASLSRGTAGIRGSTVIANLPGNPKGVAEVVPILLPLLLHAHVDLHG